MLTLRLAPLPLIEMLETGTNVVLDDVPVTVSEAADVSASATVKASRPVAVSSLTA